METRQHAQQGASDALVGRLLEGRYRIGARIARGGMASVYEATDIRLDRTVAVKVMHAGLGDDEEFAARFVREARSAARLNHPNVVGVFDQGSDGDTVFLVMEHVAGRTLRDVVRAEAPLSPPRALALLEPVVSALAAAHRAGLVHRDVKPENVLIEDPDAGGRVKVADFGLAKAVSADTQHTVTGGVLIGTVSYLAPELVVEGRSDARADVYAVGVMMFEMLTGTKPHEGESPIQVAYKHVHEDVPPPSRLVPGIPPYVDALVARATARDRSQRPADAGVLLHQLHRVAHALSTGTREDEELTADLLPLRTAAIDLDRTDPFDVDWLRDGAQVADGREPTTSLDAASVSASVAEAVVPPAEPAPPSGHEHAGAVLVAPSAPAPPVSSAQPVRPVATRTVVPGRAPRPRRSRRGPILLVLALLLAGGVGGGAWWFGEGRYTTTPGVLQLDAASAEAELAKAGLGAEIGDPVYSESVPADVVLTTDPEPGSRVLDGGTVTLVMSLGPERYEVPVVAGMGEDQAQDTLLGTNLAVGERIEKYSEQVPPGSVIRSKPAPGTVLKPDAEVRLVVSLGRKPRPVEDFTGRSAAEAERVLEQRSLVVERTGEEYSDTVPAGSVISQTPTEGTLFKGDTVQIVVSLGPELVEVPTTRAMGVEEATDRLEDLGFEVETEQSSNYLGLGYVFSSDPGAGEMVPKGSTITLYLI